MNVITPSPNVSVQSQEGSVQWHWFFKGTLPYTAHHFPRIPGRKLLWGLQCVRKISFMNLIPTAHVGLKTPFSLLHFLKVLHGSRRCAYAWIYIRCTRNHIIVPHPQEMEKFPAPPKVASPLPLSPQSFSPVFFNLGVESHLAGERGQWHSGWIGFWGWVGRIAGSPVSFIYLGCGTKRLKTHVFIQRGSTASWNNFFALWIQAKSKKKNLSGRQSKLTAIQVNFVKNFTKLKLSQLLNPNQS